MVLNFSDHRSRAGLIHIYSDNTHLLPVFVCRFILLGLLFSIDIPFSCFFSVSISLSFSYEQYNGLVSGIITFVRVYEYVCPMPGA